MRVSVTRGGGFGGLVRTTTADTARLSPGDGQEMQTLVRRAGLQDDRPAPDTGEPEPDRFTYTVTVEDGGHRQVTTFPEQSLPGQVRDLISWVGKVDGHQDRVEPPGGAGPLSPVVDDVGVARAVAGLVGTVHGDPLARS